MAVLNCSSSSWPSREICIPFCAHPMLISCHRCVFQVEAWNWHRERKLSNSFSFPFYLFLEVKEQNIVQNDNSMLKTIIHMLEEEMAFSQKNCLWQWAFNTQILFFKELHGYFFWIQDTSVEAMKQKIVKDDLTLPRLKIPMHKDEMAFKHFIF